VHGPLARGCLRETPQAGWSRAPPPKAP
jgi:hypothetical protein